jgi:hypothetical protein
VGAFGLGLHYESKNQPALLREAERFTTGPPAAVKSESSDRELRWWHLPQVDWPVAYSAGDQFEHVGINLSSARERDARAEAPVEAEAGPMPAHDGFRFEDDECIVPAILK